MEIFVSSFFIFLYVVIALFIMYCYFRIVTKAGFAWEYGILAFIPVINIVWFIIFAFDTWPIEETFKHAKSKKSNKNPNSQI